MSNKNGSEYIMSQNSMVLYSVIDYGTVFVPTRDIEVLAIYLTNNWTKGMSYYR